VLHQLLSDLRYGLRVMRKAPVATAIAVASLGFAIATNTTTFSVASGFLFESFRWEKPRELMFAGETNRNDTEGRGISPGDYAVWRESSTRLAGIEAWKIHPSNLTGGEEPERVDLVETTPGLFDLLGRRPFLGRGFAPGDATPEGGRVVVLTQPFFQHRFGGDPAALGSTLAIDGQPHTVIGVLPDDFDFLPADVEVFRPVDLAARRNDFASHPWTAVARVAPGSSIDDARAELATVSQRVEREQPETHRGYGARVRSLREVFPGRVDTRLQYILLTVSALVLVIASANLVSLYLARGDARRCELALRMALGAGNGRVGRQLMTESLLVAGIGGVLGIVGSIFWVSRVDRFIPAALPEVFHPHVSVLVLLYGVLVSLVAGTLLGAVPALQASRVAPAVALGEISRGGTSSRRRRRLRAGFIVAETAMALALLTGAGILTDTFQSMVRENGKIAVDGVLAFELTADENRFPTDDDVAAFYREVHRRIAALPGVESAAILSTLPRSMDNPRHQFTIDGRPEPAPSEAPWTYLQSVSPEYFATLGIPIVAGRAIGAGDRADTAPVVMINESFARRQFPGEDPLGRRLTIWGASREIVGVCGDFRQERMPDLDGTASAMFAPIEQHPIRSATFAARVAGDPMALAAAVREAVWSVDRDQPVTSVETLRHHIEESLSGPRVIARALTIMGAVALLLSAIGIYGLISHDVSQRRREFGIRMALGAPPGRVVGSVTLRGLAVTGIGMLVGIPAAWAMERMIASTFQGLAPINLGSIGLLVLLLIAVALVASSTPAWVAGRIRPARALQLE
jgi:predicted permease